MRADPYIMKAVVEQNINIGNCDSFDIIIEKHFLKIKYYWLQIAEIPIDKEYDTYWADIFARIVLSKGISWVTLRIIGES